MIGSTVITRPVGERPAPSRAKFGTSGSSWIVRPMPWPVSSAQHAEAAALDLGLDGGADRADVRRRPSRRSSAELSARLRGGDEPRSRPAHAADGTVTAGVGVEAVELGGDVELDELALAQAARAGDAVDRLVVDADAGRAGEVVVEPRAGARAVARRRSARRPRRAPGWSRPAGRGGASRGAPPPRPCRRPGGLRSLLGRRSTSPTKIGARHRCVTRSPCRRGRSRRPARG